jgi:hypothetical protein
MKNVTITLDDAVAARARVEAASRGESLSKFVRDLIEREIGRKANADRAVLDEFFEGPGYPGISKNWRGREGLYAERENDLLRRYERAGVHGGSRRTGAKIAGDRIGAARDRKKRARPKSAKS